MKRFLFIISFLYCCISTFAYDFVKDGIYYRIIPNTNEVEVTDDIPNRPSYKGDVTIPSTVTVNGETYKVTGIYYAFDECPELNNVILPNTIKSIKVSFNLNSLAKIFIPASVSYIDNYSFKWNNYLESIIISSENPWYDSRDNCNAIVKSSNSELVRACKNTIIPNSVNSIGKLAYEGVQIKKIIIPEGVKSIGYRAFRGTEEIEEFSFPKTLTSLDEEAFVEIYSNIKTINVDPENELFDSRDNCNALIESAKNKIRFACASTTIPTSVTVIGTNAFCMCKNLEIIHLPEGITEIENSAFWSCQDLKEIVLPKSLKKIGFGVFTSCPNVENVKVSWNTEESIPYCSFYNSNVPYTAKLLIPSGTLSFYRKVDDWKTFRYMEEYADESAIHGVILENSYSLYSIDGIKLRSAPQKGIYINKNRKIFRK